MKPLTAPQEAFARGVASGLSQAEAYRRAYPGSKEWKDSSVHVAASKLMADAKVAQRVGQLAKLVEKEFAIDTAGLLREAHRLAHSDIGRIMHTTGKKAGQVKLPHELDDDTRAAVASFKIDEYGRIEYKFWDKNSAHDRLFKHKGLYEKDNEQQKTPIRQIRLVALTAADKGKR